LTGATIVDTGPIVALLSESDRWHGSAKEQFAALRAPLAPCESVLAEASYLLGSGSRTIEGLFGLLERSVLEVEFKLAAEHRALRALMRRYADVPMSLADACLVRMSELSDGASVLTLDSDFRVYRRLGRQTIRLIAPGIG
jgi:predicted nucleic acid-binding protein